MKQKFTLLIAALILAAVSFGLLTNCKSSKPATLKDQGETEIIVPCAGPEYMTDNEHFRADGIGESMDQMTSKKKALTAARAQLAAQVDVLVKTVTDDYVKSGEFDNKEEILERYESLTREVVKQKLTGTKTICQKMTQTKGGNYKTYVAIELAGNELLSALNNRLSNDEMLKIDYNYEKFKKTFEEEMNKMND
ncbi:MAG: LPP20 family lipoprotein [Bacteroidales bacterium]|nr:LPP20 family lipoprotein [Bacteroidales bacterium]